MGVVLFIYGLLRNNRSVLISGLIVFVVVAILIPVVYYSGHAAGEIVEELPGIDEAFIDKHASAAEFTYYSGILMGFLSAVVLYLQMVRRYRDMFYRIMLILVLLSSFFFVISSAITGNYGGRIRHGEIVSQSELQELELRQDEGEGHSH